MKTDIKGPAERLKPYAPPGAELKQYLVNWAWSVMFMFFQNLLFLIRLSNAVSDLYFRDGVSKYLRPNAQLPAFGELARSSLWGFWIIVFLAFYTIWSDYSSFSRETKSIYVMKRLKDSGELIRRCVSIPLLMVAAGMVAALILMGWNLAIYNIIPPKGYPQPIAFGEIWRSFLWLW